MNSIITYQGVLKSNTMTKATNVIRLKRIRSKRLTQMFCLTVAHRVVLKDFLAIYSKVIGFYLYAQRLPYVQRHEP